MTKAQQIVKGLTLLMVHAHSDGRCSANYSMLYCSGDAPTDCQPSLVADLDSCGWHWDDLYDCWRIFT